MSTTLSPIRVTKAPDIDMEQLRDGLANASAAAPEELDASLLIEHPAFLAWERMVVDEAIEEIAPDVARMLEAAIQRRLPWTWEERS